jgi:predicted RecB family nuclease
MQKRGNQIVYSPSDLVNFLVSPFASWMDRYYLEHPDKITRDPKDESLQLIAETGNQHEARVLAEMKQTVAGIVEISMKDPLAFDKTKDAINAKTQIIYQGKLVNGIFEGFTDFLQLDQNGEYVVWDTKVACSPKPYYAIQLCCYSEMLAATCGTDLPERFGIILGTGEEVLFRVDDFIHYYRRVRDSFLALQDGFTGDFKDRPEPMARANHGRWTSHADAYLDERDHLVRVAGISVGQIRKLNDAGIQRLEQLATANGIAVKKMAEPTLKKLTAQAKLQHETREDRKANPDARPRFQVLNATGPNGEPIGLASLPAAHPADVFFDMEGYPLMLGGLEYLFGASTIDSVTGEIKFQDWWAHDRDQEKLAVEAFVDWVFARWLANPGMHIYHYAAYEVSAVRRLSTRHDTRQDEVDQLLRNNVFVDLYQIVRKGLMIGEDSYSIKSVERLYRPKRSTQVATAADSIVQYAHWIASQEPQTWTNSGILKGIRDYNEDDCKSTVELAQWLRAVATKHNVELVTDVEISDAPTPPANAQAGLDLAAQLRAKGDEQSIVLADLLGYHRREAKPVHWRMFDRAEKKTDEELREDAACIEGVILRGGSVPEKKSLLQEYTFDASQECKLKAGDKSSVMFKHNITPKLGLFALDNLKGTLKLKATQKTLNDHFGGSFPSVGTLLADEFVPPGEIPGALTAVASQHLNGNLHAPVRSLLDRNPPKPLKQFKGQTAADAAVQICNAIAGECLVIQGPPGTGKTYTASQAIVALLAKGKTVGVTSNSHKAVVNLLSACGDTMRAAGSTLAGIKVGDDGGGPLFQNNPKLKHVANNSDGRGAFKGGIVGGTAWLFARPEWQDQLDFLFIDEAGQFPLANAVAVSRCAKNLVLMGDQMQLEQPIQGSHPGDAGMSVLQYALKDTEASKPDAPVFHPVISSDFGLFLGESRRMHSSVCQFISESIYERRLKSHPDCDRQTISIPQRDGLLVNKSTGVVFSGIEHDANIQRSDEEVERVIAIYNELLGRDYTDKNDQTRPLTLADFLFIAPYNAQVRELQAALPADAKVGSVDKFQGQEAPVCILSMCSSYGEYGSRGLAFILDRNRINVAISRAQCLAIVVADPRISYAEAGSLEEMSLINLFCRLADS